MTLCTADYFIVVGLLLAACGDDLGSAGDVAYADEWHGMDNPICAVDSPCSTLGGTLATGAREIHVTGNFNEQVTIRHRTVTIVGIDSQLYNRPSLTWGGRGPAIDVTDDSDVVIRNLVVTLVSDETSAAVVMEPDGDCRLTILESEIWNNAGRGIEVRGGWFSLHDSVASGNPHGGISIDTPLPFEVIDNDIGQNGSPRSIVGGLGISSGEGQVSGNVLIDNQAQPGIGTAIDCVGLASVHDNYVRGPEPTVVLGGGDLCWPLRYLLDVLGSQLREWDVVSLGA